ncbi:alkaline phosphatase 4-like [Zophobas morio]|uniref:alkaline phosphatase 4-like n=1 Tax=Zophobas morio TaxID=2755281 RepID=UPI0030835464
MATVPLVLCLLSYFFSPSFAAVIVQTNKNLFENIEPTPDAQLLKEDQTFWYGVAGDYLEEMIKLDQQPKKHVAKNVVIMIGDGMGIPTVTATRIYKGQRNYGKSGEDHKLVYENFPSVALVKTYNVDMQVPDSAGTATALFSGVKTRYEAVGVDVQAHKEVPDSEIFEKSKIEGIMTWAQNANKDTGIITTTRITHATPASTYAHCHHRDWECDSEVPQNFKPFVKDIARQLVEDAPGKNFKVILGGGYQQLGYITQDLSDGECVRTDGLNLTESWIAKHENLSAAFVSNNEQLANIGDVDCLLGLFHHDHVPYDLLRDEGPKGTPRLSEMTLKGLNILKKNPNGFVLMIEGGRIDHGHHDNYARLALAESAEFEKTISLVVEETDSDTLIIVTADHSHSMTINGYGQRGNDILGYGLETEDDKPALTLSYANGPGFAYHYSPNVSSILGPWIDVRTDDINRLNNPEYQHLATFEVDDETHGGEDVGIFATGPSSHLIRGVMEQNYVAHLISYAACIGPRATANPYCNNFKSSAANYSSLCSWGIILLILVIVSH